MSKPNCRFYLPFTKTSPKKKTHILKAMIKREWNNWHKCDCLWVKTSKMQHFDEKQWQFRICTTTKESGQRKSAVKLSIHHQATLTTVMKDKYL